MKQLSRKFRKKLTYYHFDQRREILKEIKKANDHENRAYAEYHDLKKLLKESGYILANKTTDNDRDITSEIWHKNKKGH